MSSASNTLARSMRDDGITVFEFDMTTLLGFIRAIRMLRKLCRDSSKTVVHSWLYKANLFTTIALVGIAIPHAWNIRQTNIAYQYNSLSTVLAIYLLSMISRLKCCVNTIVYCAELSRHSHESIGFRKDNALVIPNGIDIDEFEQYIDYKHNLPLPLEVDYPLVINVGRYDIQKGHGDFLRCAAIIKQKVPNVRFQLIGRNVTPENKALLQQVDQLGLNNLVSLMGEQENIGSYLSRAHVFLSCSAGEGWPNALAEAMLIGLPVVHTDVGDAKIISGIHDYCFPVGAIEEMADKVVHLLNLPNSNYQMLSLQMSRRIQEKFPLNKSVSSYTQLYLKLAENL